jgi:hypothetical protein
MPKYRITGGPTGIAGLDYRSTRVEPGDVVDDLPRESIKWLREQGYVELVGKDAEEEPIDVVVVPKTIVVNDDQFDVED